MKFLIHNHILVLFTITLALIGCDSFEQINSEAKAWLDESAKQRELVADERIKHKERMDELDKLLDSDDISEDERERLEEERVRLGLGGDIWEDGYNKEECDKIYSYDNHFDPEAVEECMNIVCPDGCDGKQVWYEDVLIDPDAKCKIDSAIALNMKARRFSCPFRFEEVLTNPSPGDGPGRGRFFRISEENQFWD